MGTDQWRRPRVRGSQRNAACRSEARATIVSSFGPDETAKRILDILAATTGMILFAPILLIIPIAVKLRLPQIRQILGETGIDGLPQLFAVLRGEMSIFGRRNVHRWPRPADRSSNHHRRGGQ
jgi:lipopolysaccharide/colanic/teichoic acid biosynthesis glycosyltransferase